MIIETILNLLAIVITTVFGILPNIPNLPENMINGVYSVINVIFDNLSLLGCFVRPSTIVLAVPIVIVIYNFDKIYKITLWILKKIPMLGID